MRKIYIDVNHGRAELNPALYFDTDAQAERMLVIAESPSMSALSPHCHLFVGLLSWSPARLSGTMASHHKEYCMTDSTVLKTYRLNRNWSQEQLAEMSGLSVRTIQRIEQGKRAGLESWKSLSAVFEIPIAELQGDLISPNGDNEMNTASAPMNSQQCHNQPSQPVCGCSRPDNQASAAEPPKQSSELSQEEARALREVRLLRRFYFQLLRYLVVIGFLVVINWLTSPGYWWVIWPAAIWGLAILLSGLRFVTALRIFDAQWERREVEKRLNKRL